jgi:aquaporin Z
MAVNWTSALVAEFVGTFLLVFTVGCNVLGNTGAFGAVSIACVLMVSIYAFGAASGANFNPAVSFALGLMEKLGEGSRSEKWKLVGAYCAAQLAAGLCAGLCYHQLFHKGFPLKPTPGLAIGAILCEIAYTFMLVFVVLNTAASKKKGGKNQYYGLAIGFVIIAGGYASGPLGAGCFNPAVAFGIFAGDLFRGLGWCIVYTIAELVGATLAVFLFKMVRNEDEAPSPSGPEPKLLCEAIGTFMLVLTVGLNVLGSSKAGALSIAASLTSMIYAIGDVSGGHFNPAVTVAIHGCGKAPPNWGEAAKYIGAQLTGGFLAAVTYALAYGGTTFPLGPGVGHDWTSVAVAEAMFTFVLCFVVLGVAVVDDKPAEEFIGLIIGSCVTAGGYAIGALSGGCLNPAVSFAIALTHVAGGGLFFKALVYAFFEFVGALMAAGLFSFIYGGAGKLGKTDVATDSKASV